MRKYVAYLIVLAVAGAVLIAGCTSPAAEPGPSTGGTGAVSVTVVDLSERFEPSGECYWHVRVAVKNTGGTEVRNVNVNLELVDEATGDVRATDRSIFLERVGPGENNLFDKNLFGDCGRTYRIEPSATYDNP